MNVLHPSRNARLVRQNPGWPGSPAWSRRFDKRPPEAPYNHHFSDSGLQSRTKPQNIFSFHYSIFLFYFISTVLKTDKKERKKKVCVFQEGIFVKAINWQLKDSLKIHPSRKLTIILKINNVKPVLLKNKQKCPKLEKHLCCYNR